MHSLGIGKEVLLCLRVPSETCIWRRFEKLLCRNKANSISESSQSSQSFYLYVLAMHYSYSNQWIDTVPSKRSERRVHLTYSSSGWSVKLLTPHRKHSSFCNSSGLHSKAPCQPCCKINTQQPLLTNTPALPSGMTAPQPAKPLPDSYLCVKIEFSIFLPLYFLFLFVMMDETHGRSLEVEPNNSACGPAFT